MTEMGHGRLTEEERREIAAEIAGSEYPRAAASDALKIVQRHRGWVGGEIVEVAAMLGMAPAELESVATWYSLIFREPVGRHVILICDSVSCWITGYRALLDHLTGRLGIGLGGTTADARFTLLPVACLGACEQAPAMMVDEDLHGDLTPEKIDAILEQYP
ncbi:MAG: NADH-quinone oxidoreductase subunit NuoE [Desulfobacteraceae bacterium]|nr:NADH-quinone oxidoreductase subunit NuoE [Desulfobacteraceae bacterium]